MKQPYVSDFGFRISLVCLVFLISYFVFGVSPVKAQQATLSISPPVVEILIAPNKRITQTFIVKHDGAVVITPTLHLFKPSGVNGQAQIDPNPLTPPQIPLVVTSSLPLGNPYHPSSDLTEITLTIEAPTTDTPQDLYFALLVTTEPVASFATASTTAPGIASLIVATVNPGSVYPIDVSLENFDTPHIQDSALALTLSPLLKNNTDLMIRPGGKYEVFAPSGKTVFSTNLYPNLVLGNSSRLVQADGPAPLEWTPTWKDLGPYRHRLTIETQGGSKLVESEKTVWVFPIRASIVIFLGVLVLILIWRSSMRSSSSKYLTKGDK